MKLLTNENVPSALVNGLRAAGHDVNWVSEASPGITDLQVIKLAILEGRLLVTFDKDFGELAFRQSLPAPCGVILLRLPMDDLNRLTSMTVEIINSRDDWQGQFAVIEETRIRLRLLPSV